MFINSQARMKELSQMPDHEINVVEAALVIASETYPDLDIAQYLTKVEQLAEEAENYMQPALNLAERVSQMNEFLFVAKEFVGNDDDYYDPRNSFLNEVLDRKTGIPITLAIVYIGVAQHLGESVYGINFPGHFLMKWVGVAEEILIDPFFGKVISLEECEQKFAAFIGKDMRLEAKHLRKASSRDILIRILRNLKGVYLQKQRFEDVLSCSHRILLLNPDLSMEYRDRGLVYYQLECFQEAAADLEAFLQMEPSDVSSKLVRNQLETIRSQARRVN